MTKTAWKKRIKDDCIQAGTYAEWCESIIDTLAAILEKRDMEKFIKRQQRKEGTYGKAAKRDRPETI